MSRMIRCEEVVFDALIPIPGHPNAVTQARFCDEDGWTIFVDTLGITLYAPGIEPFVVVGYGCSYRVKKVEPEAAPQATGPEYKATVERTAPGEYVATFPKKKR